MEEMIKIPKNKKGLSSPKELIENKKETLTISKIQMGGNI